MLFESFSQIKFSDITGLVENKVPESKYIDYKSKLPNFSNDKEKEGFINDVCAFANASGGYIVYGMEEKDGFPTAISGIEISNSDGEIRKITEVIRTNTEPSFYGSDIKIVEDSTKKVLILKIIQSLNKPHAAKKSNRFYIRASACNQPMDVFEVRNAVLTTEGFQEKIKNFRAKRISELLYDNSPIPLQPYPKLVFHLIPVYSFLQNSLIDINKYLDSLDSAYQLPLMRSADGSDCINIDGVFRHRGLVEGGSHGYTMLFRNGSIESVNSIPPCNGKTILQQDFEQQILSFYNKCEGIFRELQITPPIVIFLTLIGVKNVVLIYGNNSPFDRDEKRFDRDIIQTPDILINEFLLEDSLGLDKVFKPLFDMIWNGAGYPSSFNYDKSGVRKDKTSLCTEG